MINNMKRKKDNSKAEKFKKTDIKTKIINLK